MAKEGIIEMDQSKVLLALAGIVSAIIIGLLGWGGANLVATRADIAVFSTQLTDATRRIESLESNLNAATSYRYTSSDASRDREEVSHRISETNDRVQSLEKLSADLLQFKARLEERYLNKPQ